MALSPEIHATLLVFVLGPAGRVEVVASRPMPAALAGRTAQRFVGGGDSAFVRRAEEEFRRQFAGLEVTSRVRPLLPRVNGAGRVLLPLWAMGRPEGRLAPSVLDDADGEQAHVLRRARDMSALDEIELDLGDRSLRAEAESEFRRALAADPLALQMVGEEVRMRTLASDEVSRAVESDARPPVLALLPEHFTIDELRLALASATTRMGEKGESSSNFRRRTHELVAARVLQEVGEFGRAMPRGAGEAPERAGRRPRLHRFDPAAWMAWLTRKARQSASVVGPDDAKPRSVARRAAMRAPMPSLEHRMMSDLHFSAQTAQERVLDTDESLRAELAMMLERMQRDSAQVADALARLERRGRQQERADEK